MSDRSELVYASETAQPSPEAPDLTLKGAQRTREGDLTPPRWGKKSDLSWRTTDGIVHPVTVKRVS